MLGESDVRGADSMKNRNFRMTTYNVKGMTCGHCVKAVTAAVQQVDAQARVEVDLATGKVQVDSTLPAPAIERAIAEAGYEAQTLS